MSLPGLIASAGPLHEAASTGDVQRLAASLKGNPGVANLRDEEGATLLHWAVDGNQKAVIEMLLAGGADVNARKSNGVAPLHIAAAFGRCDLALLLLNKGADASATDKKGRTPLSIARRRGLAPMVDLLESRSPIVPPAAGTLPAINGGKAVAYESRMVRGIPLNLVYVRLDDPRVRVRAAISGGGVGTTESFGSFIRRLNPTAAVNATFFCSDTYLPIGDIVIDNRLVYFGGMGTGVCITADNKVEFVTSLQGRHNDWSKYQTVICSGPRLLIDDRVVVNPGNEGFSDPHVLGIARRTAVGLTSMNRLLFLNTKRACSLSTLACIMRDLECLDAINLDGGSSIAMYYRGRTITHPSRSLTNLLLVYEDSGA